MTIKKTSESTNWEQAFGMFKPLIEKENLSIGSMISVKIDLSQGWWKDNVAFQDLLLRLCKEVSFDLRSQIPELRLARMESLVKLFKRFDNDSRITSKFLISRPKKGSWTGRSEIAFPIFNLSEGY